MNVEGSGGAAFGIVMIIYLAVVALFIISNWIIFKKAGKPGWASIIPIYNFIVFLEIVKKPLWWIILMFIPFVNFIISIILINRLSLSFGKSVGFTIGLIFLPFIFIPVLAFSDAQYSALSD